MFTYPDVIVKTLFFLLKPELNCELKIKSQIEFWICRIVTPLHSPDISTYVAMECFSHSSIPSPFGYVLVSTAS